MSLKIPTIAKICHEVNRAYCEALGDFSQKPWEEAEYWQTESAENGVLFVLNNPAVSAESLHINWMEEKAKTGWIYGPVKDVLAKQHPCMVPYAELPPGQKMKDVLFRAVVGACLEPSA